MLTDQCQDTRSSMAASSTTSSGSGLSTHEVDVQEVVGFSRVNNCQKLGTNCVMDVELSDADPGPGPMAAALALQDTRSTMGASSSTSCSSGLSTHEVEIQGVKSLLGNDRNVDKNDMVTVDVTDDDPEPRVSTLAFLCPETTVEPSAEEIRHLDDLKKPKEEGSFAWSEEELDALWAAVRRHGPDWPAVRLDSKFPFKCRSDSELAEQWKADQLKFFGKSDKSGQAPPFPGDGGDQAFLPFTSETDALSAAVRKHGPDWPAVRHDAEFPYFKCRSESELAELWKAAQLKIFGKSDKSGQAPPSAGDGADQALLLRTSETESVKLPGSDVVVLTESISEPVEVYQDERLGQLPQYQEKKDPCLWVLSEAEPPPLQLGPSKLGGPSTLSDLQLVEQLGELGRLEGNRQAVSLRNLLDGQFNSSPVAPSLFSGRGSFTSGSVSLTNGANFGPHSESLGTPDNKFGLSGSVLDRIGAEFSLGLPDWRRQEARDLSSWPQQPPYYFGPDQADLLVRNSVLRSQEGQVNLQFPSPPNNRMESAMGHGFGSNILVSLPHNGGLSSTTEHRKRSRAVPNAKATSAVSTQDTAPSKLPHWLREAVKGHSAPAQPPLPPAIAAVVQATNVLYKDSKRLLPPLIHPGYPMVPPREFPKKVAKREHPSKVGQFLASSRTDSLLVGHLSNATEFTHPTAMDNHTQLFLPIPSFESAGSGMSRSLPVLEQGNGLPSSSGRGYRPPESDITWKRSDALDSNILPSSGPILAWQQFSRNTGKANLFSETVPGTRVGERSFSDTERISQLPHGLLLGDPSIKRDGMQRIPANVEVLLDDDDEESTSSKTVSDPGVRSNIGKEDSNSDDASSEETISDDGTQ